MKRITKRDVKIFLLGMLIFFLIESILNWKETKDSFMRGWNGGTIDAQK